MGYKKTNWRGMGIGHFVCPWGPWGVGLFFALERSRLSLGDQPRVPNKQLHESNFLTEFYGVSVIFCMKQMCKFQVYLSLIVKLLKAPKSGKKQQEYKIHLSVYNCL